MGESTGWMRTTHGRLAGIGIVEDDYSEESGCKPWKPITAGKDTKVRFPNDKKNPEDLNGECIIVQEGRKKDD